jgi:hypothetical protein
MKNPNIDMKVLIVPGVSSPLKGDYQDVYALIKRAAREQGLDPYLISHPGHDGRESGELSYEAALDNAKEKAVEVGPDWLIARSFGCDIAVGLLQQKTEWVERCQGAVLWGPALVTTVRDRLFPSRERRKKEIESYKEWDTFLASDFIESIPSLAEKIRHARCNMRLVAGSKDDDIGLEDLEFLAARHKKYQYPDYITDVNIIGGLGHTVTQEEYPEFLVNRYLELLFTPIEA